MAVKKLRKPLEINNDGTSIVGLGYDTNGNPIVLLKGPSDNRAKSIQYNGIVPKIYIDELRDSSFLNRKDDIKKLLKYRKEFQSSIENTSVEVEEVSPELEETPDNIDVANVEAEAGKSANDVKKTIKDLTEQINQAIEYDTQDEIDRLEDGLQKAFKELKDVKAKETEATITVAKSAMLSLKEYDGLIDGLMRDANFDLKEGDFSKGKIVLDWHSGSNVSIEFEVKALWEERKIEVIGAKLDISGLENLNDSKLWGVIDKYLTDFEVPFDRPTDASTIETPTEKVEELIKTHDEVKTKSVRILNKGNWNEAEIKEVDDSETEYRMTNKDINFSTIEDMINSMLDLAEVNGDYDEAIDFLSDISLSDSIIDYKDETGFIVSDISDFLDETVTKWEKDRGYNTSINANITKVIANIID